MLKLAMRPLALLAIPAALAVTASGSFAAPTAAPTTFGNATFNQQGVLLTSDVTNTTPYAGIDIPLPAGTTLSDIKSLDATYQMVQGNCSGGSPRFSITVPGSSNVPPPPSVFAYLGTGPNYANCAPGVQSQQNVLQPNVDTSQIPGGMFYDTYGHALTLAGSRQVSELALVVDGGWAVPGGIQSVEVYAVSVNGTEYNLGAPTSKDQCKNGGWMTFINPGTFKNQGDCVSYVATHGKNPPNG